MTKRFTLILSLFILGVVFIKATNVPFDKIELVAKNFIFQTTQSANQQLTLANTVKNSNGTPLFYVFNLSTNGFVIVAADDAASPIIGYSTEDNFKMPEPNSNIGNWLAKRQKEIDHLIDNHIQANAAISQLWKQYIENNTTTFKRSATSTTVAPLLTTKWNQSPFYNALCPGGSVTGCVATAMAQIIKYWNYPLHGVGTHSYCDCTSEGYPNDYGVLSADFGNATYNYANMPNSLIGPNAEIAKLMYHCGVSVEMNYDPSGSSAMVINYDSPVSAQNSYATYFGYDPYEMSGTYRSFYTDAQWHAKLKFDLEVGRPIQYVGFGSQGGHTWVCDGYDENNFYHMNWGWGGSSNGFYSIDALNPSGMDFNDGQEALTGIIPAPTVMTDAGIFGVTPSNNICVSNVGSPVIKIRNYGFSNLTSCDVNYKIDNQNYQTINWTGNIVSGQSADVVLSNANFTSGSHTILCNTSNPNGTSDGNTTNDLGSATLNIITQKALPLIDGVEDANTYDHWSIIPSPGTDWAVTSQVAGTGVQSYVIDNNINTAGNVSILNGNHNYNLYDCGAIDFSFKVAYQQKTASSNDVLKLESSTNCGETWNLRWSKQGAALATTTVLSTDPYLPPSTDFVTHTVTIPYFQDVIFRWVFIADPTSPGNNLFLDDINLSDPTVGLKEQQLGIGLNVFPNPAKEKVTVNYNAKESHVIEITVTDILGNQVYFSNKGRVESGNNAFDIETNNLKTGVYFLNLKVDNTPIVKKIVIQN